MPRDIIGETLLNQFRVESYIASGGMATIFRVWDLQRSVPLAMKVLHPELAEDPAFIARFRREAQSLQTLVHPHIVPFYGLYQANDLTFLLERYIDGPSLDEILRKRGGRPLPLFEALVYFKALYTSLGYGHAHGIVHCDIKPGNVLIDQGGHVYLTDFGIARYMDTTITTSQAIGTPLYMAPEQIRGERLGPHTDVYSLGVLMFELLTGQRPFRGDVEIPPELGNNQADRIRYQHLYQPPPSPRAINPELLESVSQVILRAMAKDPAERYPTALAMAQDLSKAIAARFETLPDRVLLPEDMRHSLEWKPQQQEPIPYLDSPYRGETSDWQPMPPPRDTLSGLPSAPRAIPPALPDREVRPRRWMGRLPLLIAMLLLLSICVLGGVSLARAITDGARTVLPVAPTQMHTPSTQTPETTTTPLFEFPWPFDRETETPTPEATATIEAEATETPTQETEGGLVDFPVSGEFALVRRMEGGDRLVLYNADSGEQNTLPTVPNVNVTQTHAPQWSPDGRRLTWMSRYSDRMHIVVMDLDEREPYQLPAGEGFERVSSPSWLGDSESVVFWAFGNGANWMVIADAVSGELTDQIRLPGYRNLFVQNWSTGRLAYIQQMNEFWEVATSSTPEASETRISIPGHEYAPAWSNDGQWLAFQADAERDPGMNEIWISRADGSELRRVTNSPEGTWSRAPTWSPDGRFIAFVSDRSGSIGADFGELFVVEVASGRITQVTDTGGQIYDWRPAWRPD
jgi:serine/threonine protein kinase